ncbi:non-homologous end joining protein Ku [Chelativorans sp. YIM 93263]|uniref:non-homologous end joining protein Ku n=1 Tax=Chelativorans sp. YIM 93263 TaxID=2906648 RepID=UPI002378A3D2|nr:Ku protein [Chelativorans sp. YIM 93263]
MAPRPYWKGYLKLSLVTCSVSLTPATTEREKMRFHTVNRDTGNRVRSRYVDAETGKPVDDDDEIRGYEIEDGEYVTFEDEELQAVNLESTRTIDIEQFVPAESIEWIWYDKPYYLMPDDEVAQEAFAVIREAMAETGTVGISRLVLSRRERAIMLQPRVKGIVLWTLRYGDEVRDPQEVFAGLEEKKTESRLVSLIEALVQDLTKPWDPAMVNDPVQKRLQDIIQSKQKKTGKQRKGGKRKQEEQSAPSAEVVSITDALRKSLSQERKKK